MTTNEQGIGRGRVRTGERERERGEVHKPERRKTSSVAWKGVRAAAVKGVAVPAGSSAMTAGRATPNAAQNASSCMPALLLLLLLLLLQVLLLDAGGAHTAAAPARSRAPQTSGPSAAASVRAMRSLHANAQTRAGGVPGAVRASHGGTVASSAAQSTLLAVLLARTRAGTRAAASTFASVRGAAYAANVYWSGAAGGPLRRAHGVSGGAAIVQGKSRSVVQSVARPLARCARLGCFSSPFPFCTFFAPGIDHTISNVRAHTHTHTHTHSYTKRGKQQLAAGKP